MYTVVYHAAIVSYWTGKTALVTGAGSGIGRALAIALAERGASVIVTDVDAAAADGVSRSIPHATSASLDVTDAAAFARVVEQAGRLDFLFNNAGTAVAGEAHELKQEHWERVLRVNVHGVVNGILAAYPMMTRQRSGHIVNIASLAGVAPAPFLVPYAASKHAVVGLSTSLRAEAVEHGVRVTVVCPAAVETPLLDRENPRDLPPIAWQPNMRRHLEKLAGPPVPVERMVEETLAGVEKNGSVIVIPTRTRIAWRLNRLFPRLVESLAARAASEERGCARKGE